MEEFLGLAQEGGAGGLQAAAALHRGDFLEGFYDEWIVNERYRPEKPICRDIGVIDGRAMGAWTGFRDRNGFSYFHIVGHGGGGYEGLELKMDGEHLTPDPTVPESYVGTIIETGGY